MKARLPSISVITAVLNAADTIRDCLESIKRQEYPVEHLIIDGGSTDGTLEILRSAADPTARIVSEPDQGIYDAMNKGIAWATGDVIGTLNADDCYAHENVLARVAEAFAEPDTDSCYGDLIYVDRANTSLVRRRWTAGHCEVKRFYQGWMPPHPTFFVRRRVYEEFGSFRLDMGSSADYELMLRFLLKHGISTHYLAEPLVIMRSGGVSNASLWGRLKANRLDRMAWKVNDLRPRLWTVLGKPLSKIGQFMFRPATTGHWSDAARTTKPRRRS